MDAFAALADPVRRDLLRRMSPGPVRVVDLAEAFPISRPAISKHLRLLAEAGLATADDRGRERHYRALPEGLGPVRSLLDELAGVRPPIAEQMLDGLELEVRRTGRERRATSPTPQEDTG